MTVRAVPFYRSILALICLSITAALVACGGGSGSSKSSGSTSPTITVALTSPPPATMTGGMPVFLQASITGDLQNKGVVWSCSPGNTPATCGTFLPNNAVYVRYTAPSVAGNVTVTATSVADSSASASAKIAITVAITVSFAQSPPPAMFTGASTPNPIQAAISGDTSSQGITWSCTPASYCGSASFSAPTNLITNFMAPANLVSATTVTITATSNADTSISASAPVLIRPLLQGNYVYSLSGTNLINGVAQPYSAAGVFNVNNNSISGGEQDYTGGYFDVIDNGGTISLTNDGNLQISITLCLRGQSGCAPDPNVGVNGIETLNGSFLPSNTTKAMITEFDGSATATGTLETQKLTSMSLPDGYAFGLNGLCGACSTSGLIMNEPLSMAGVLNIDISGNISGTGSVFDANVWNGTNGSGNEFLETSFLPSSVSSYDSLGRVTFQLNPGSGSNSNALYQIALAGYVVDTNHVQLVETPDALGGTLGGTAYNQGAYTGTFSLTSVQGSTSIQGSSYVIGLSGVDVLRQLVVAGLFTAGTNGVVSGFADYNDFSISGIQTPYTLTGGTYTVDGPGSGQTDSGTGRVVMAQIGVGAVVISNLVFYVDGNGHAMAVTLDGQDTMGGIGFQQSGGGSFTASAFKGPYVLSATGWQEESAGLNELNATGTITPTGSAGAFSGTVDLNWFKNSSSPYTALPISGNFAPATVNNVPSGSGVFTGSITGLDIATPLGDVSFSLYLIDTAGDSIGIETDTNQLTLIYLTQ
jgi:hypothetical protein